MWSSPFICGSNGHYFFSSYTCLRHNVFTPDCSLLPEKEGGKLPVPAQLISHQIHLKKRMAENEKDTPQADHSIYQLWSSFHITLHLFSKDNRTSKKVKFIRWNKQIVVEAHFMYCKCHWWLFINSSMHSLADIFVNWFYIYSEKQCNQWWVEDECYFAVRFNFWRL